MPRKAQMRAGGAVDEPNMVFPLATSYNERGVAGYTHAVTNSEDQRKINCFYEVVKNAATGKGTLSLSKRPGVTINSTSYGSTGQTAYLIQDVIELAVPAGNTFVVVNKSGAITQASMGPVTTVTILNNSTYWPLYCDVTPISNVRFMVVQLGHTVGNQRVFYSDSSGGCTVWTEITDGDFTAISKTGKMEFIDGFAFVIDLNNIIWNSDSNSLANWTASSFLAKQIRSDNPMGLARFSNRLLAFGMETVEVFYNAGNTTGSPLGRIPQLHTRVGLVLTIPPDTTNGGTHYYCTIGGRLYFVGRNTYGPACGLFMFDGSSFNKVSNSYIDKILTEKSSTLYSVNTFNCLGNIFVSIGFTGPGTSPQSFILYSPSWNEWFEWTSDVFSPVNSGQYFLGLGSNGHRVYSFAASDNWQDDGTSYSSSVQFKLPTNGSSTKFMPMYGVDADTDTGGLANTMTAEISTDDCVSFSTLGSIDLTQDRKVLFEGGSFTKAWIRLSNTNSRPYRIHNWLARIE